MTDTQLQRAPILPTVVPLIAVDRFPDDGRSTLEKLTLVEQFARGEFPEDKADTEALAFALRCAIDKALLDGVIATLTVSQRMHLSAMKLGCLVIEETTSSGMTRAVASEFAFLANLVQP